MAGWPKGALSAYICVLTTFLVFIHNAQPIVVCVLFVDIVADIVADIVLCSVWFPRRESFVDPLWFCVVSGRRSFGREIG